MGLLTGLAGFFTATYGPDDALAAEKAQVSRFAAEELRKAAEAAARTAAAPPAPSRETLAVLKTAAQLVYPATAAKVDDAVANVALLKCLQTVSSIVSDDRLAQLWLFNAGIVKLLRRLIQDTQVCEHKEELQKEASRLVAMLSTHEDVKQVSARWSRLARIGLTAGPSSSRLGLTPPPTRPDLQALRRADNADIRAWLREMAGDENCDLSSNAHKTLLHLLPFAPDAAANGAALPAPTFSDGMHLMSPAAAHHRALAAGQSGAAAAPPEADVVFIHGLRGGPFDTWRTEACGWNYSPAGMPLSGSWPTAWLQPEVPGARLLSIGYHSKILDWEGVTIPFEDQARFLADKLRRAGVGDRPVVFVCHSLGGLLVKQMLVSAFKRQQAGGGEDRVSAGAAGAAEGDARAGGETLTRAPAARPQEEEGGGVDRILANTKGIVFFSTPHYGSWMAAAGQNLRIVGLKPSPDVEILRPGPYLEALNDEMGAVHRRDGVRILSFAEADRTNVFESRMGTISTEVVSLESAYPGYGDIIVLGGTDHVNSCKPRSVEDVAFVEVVRFLKGCGLFGAGGEGGGGKGGKDGETETTTDAE